MSMFCMILAVWTIVSVPCGIFIGKAIKQGCPDIEPTLDFRLAHRLDRFL